MPWLLILARDFEDECDTTAQDIEAAMDDDLGDELFALIFTACHPIMRRTLARRAPFDSAPSPSSKSRRRA